ncbi:DUF3397 domain-containing protein [Streptococcus sp. CSL10205-OR2]|uniref:DUF3397 domain-containing protein n=1 Tax=Streptococcus sp. CSL10205-OR2 TaxID=2980558 RepID=UPI0021D86DB2|nr:DUF3397 domain-containing protein [Streptococcus sp. CSL10205-OR2]MCU9533470.1 DUF3397 domain-containing protein [Streptococcus sp. CSL10205-OR2]
MMMYKMMAILFVFITPLFSFIMVKLLGLSKYKINLADLSLPLFVGEIYLVSKNFFTHSFIFYYLIVMSLLAIGLTIWLLRSKKEFHYRRFFKFFWRAGFILTFLFYIATVVAIFL